MQQVLSGGAQINNYLQYNLKHGYQYLSAAHKKRHGQRGGVGRISQTL